MDSKIAAGRLTKDMLYSEGHELWTPNEAFFYRNTKVLGLDTQFGQISFEAFGVLSVDLSAPIFATDLFMFSIHQPLFLQKKTSFYIQIPNIFLGLGFECGLQRIRDLAILRP